MQNISDELQSQGVDARNANYGNYLLIISIKTLQKFCSTEFSPAKEYIVSISIRQEFRMLIHALKIFGVSFNYYFIIIIDSLSTVQDLNISVVGLDEDYSKHQKNTKVENRNYYVECKIESSESAATVANNQETTSEVSRKLKTFGAKHCMNWHRIFHHNKLLLFCTMQSRCLHNSWK